MLTSYTSSEEESIPYFRKFAQNIRNNNIGPQLTSMGVDRFASCENIVPKFQASSILPHLPDWSLNLLEETLLRPRLKSFITVPMKMKGWKINLRELRF